MGDDSGSGVLFTRNPSTGEKKIMGEFLRNAQGEDVVAGIRTPQPLDSIQPLYTPDNGKAVIKNEWLDKLWAICAELETHYRDMVDVEFTVQKGELYVLQSRSGKRSARAAFQIAVDLVAEGVIKRTEALKRLTKEQFKAVRRPMIDPKFKTPAHAHGLPACPGVVTGRPVFSSEDAVAAKDDVILVTHETSPNDIAGMAKSVGILTQTGGATSHAAVVARAMDRACVVGCTELIMNVVQGAKKVTIDGSTGNVWLDTDVPVIDASDDPAVRQVIDWCYELTGACENVPVDMGIARPHRIVAAEWWGSAQVLQAVLTGLSMLPIRSHITLDLTPPKTLQHPDDATLLGMFGVVEADAGFDDMISAKLADFGPKLGGLKLLGEIDDPAAAEALGFEVVTAAAAPAALPADYVTLKVLA
jgi:phosphohistidine swiveling domain-containing protein